MSRIKADPHRPSVDRATVFRGTFEHAIDAKGRTSLPAKFREVLNAKYGGEAQTIVVTPSPFDACLRAYPLTEWAALEEKLAARGSAFDPNVASLLRLFVGGAQETQVDKLGRLLLAPTLREHAQLTKEVSFVGSLKFVEIWETERFRAWKREQSEQGREALARALGDLGL